MTKKYKDFSLHFSTKNQDLEVLKKRYYDFDAETLENDSALVSELLGDEDDLVLHHCFMPEKAKETGVQDFLDTVCEEIVCWFGSSVSVEHSRYTMLRNLKRVGGVAIFLGEIKDGVKHEHELAKSLDIPCILLEV
jgi:hypothetical protein